jgi:hypothetical protein
MKTGIQLITQEREEQITKHGFTHAYTKAHPEYYQDKQLLIAAREMLATHPGIMGFPGSWDNTAMIHKMASKPYEERIVIAAALLAAEVDRLNGYIELPLIPLTEMSGEHFEQIFLTGFAPSFIKTIINTFQSLHGFHNAIAMYGYFQSHRRAVELGYDVEFTNSDEQGSEVFRQRRVRQKIDQLKKGDIGVTWTGLRLTPNEYAEAEKYYLDAETFGSEVKAEHIEHAYNVFKSRRPL